ncbi:hypothetical protein JTE90_000107 [Oedothorax gibbosus]|uniref:MADF domain-containing protein n=1 Tax=Oedothorax gibbosus TaxID=931172 RepID=A0AAV6V2E9_9ARAC|nr:hypothetical protein JTE90_000107 [Oedothorax gibbosus]
MERSGIHNEILINEVHKRRSLWDQKSLDYNNRALKSKDWESVSEELNTSVDEVKNHWKLLKDSFNSEVRNLKHNSNTPKWIHMEQMSFLLSGTNSLLLPTAYLAHIEADNQSNASSCDNKPLVESVYSLEERPSPPSKKKKINHNYAQSSNLSTHFQPSNVSKILGSNMLQSTPALALNDQGTSRPEHSNADYLFLMSLLPTFKKMSPKRKMLLKIKMMQDVYNVMFNDSEVLINNNSCDSGFNSVSSGS